MKLVHLLCESEAEINLRDEEDWSEAGCVLAR